MTHPQDWRSLYPFESRLTKIGGLHYHFLDEGSGEVLLMVHGNPTWSFLWRNLILAFRDRYRLVAPDHVGCGMSDKPQNYPYSLSRHIDNLCTFIEQLDLRNVTLLAHDWGGAIGLGTALSLRERFSRLVLFNTAAFPPPYIPWRIRACRIPLLGTWAIRRLNAFARSALWMATTRPLQMQGAVGAGFLAPYDHWTRRVAIDKFVQDIPLTSRHPTYRTLAQIEERLAQLADRPCTLIWGMKDWCFRPQCLQKLNSVFVKAEVHQMPNAGHYVTEDAHDQVVPIVESFLNRHPATWQKDRKSHVP